MTPAPPETSVIILNRNGRELLAPCLESVLAQEVQGGFEVVCVDNGSDDGSGDLVRESFPGVRLVEAGRNLGFAAGNNLGLREATGRYIVLLNNDTRARPGFLAALRRRAASNPKAAAVTAKLLFAARPDVIQNAGVLLLDDGAGVDRGAGEPDSETYAAAAEVFGFCGAGALLRREALEDAGTFDEAFFMYYEDTDLSWRLRLRGWHILYEPAAIVEHVHAATTGEWSAFFTFHADRNRILMLLKNAPAGMVLRAAAALVRRGTAGGGAPGHEVSAGVHGRVVLSLLRLLPHALRERSRIRGGRRVADSAWKALVYPRERWERHG